MWGLCLDRNAIQEGLFQTVIQYEMTENGEVLIILPETVYKAKIFSVFGNYQYLQNTVTETRFLLVITLILLESFAAFIGILN